MSVVLFAIAAAHAGVVPGARADLDDVYAPRRVAVLIGVQDYEDPALQGLRFPGKDATDLGAALGDPDIGAFDRVFVIQGAASTTADGIHNAIAVATADLQRDDTFVLYLSGHGTLTLDAAEGSQLWFLPSDSTLAEPEATGLAIADLEDLVTDLPARRRVLIMDTCHNGRATDGMAGRAAVNDRTAQLLAGMRGDPPVPRGLRDVSESEARLFAAQYHQPAMEDPSLQNGVYTHYLLKAITDSRRQADLDGDGLVDVAEAHDFSRDATIRHTSGLQVPRAEYRIVGREEIYLSGDPSRRGEAEQALLSAYDDMLASARLFVDGVPRGGFPGLTPVEPGRRRVEIQSADGRTLARRTVTLDPGATLSVESLLDRDPAWMWTAGAVVHQGPGADAWHPASGELELTRVDPWVGPHWLRNDLHLRASGMTGTVPEQGDVQVSAGDIGMGGMLGVRVGMFSLGPSAELMVPWRSFTNETGAHNQATLTAAVGGRGLVLIPFGARAVALRVDSRVAPYQHDATWTRLWHHGVALGIAAGR